MRAEEERGKGYFGEDFTDACARYLPKPGVSSGDSVTTPANTGEFVTFPSVTDHNIVTPLKQHCEAVGIGLSRCHPGQAPGSAERQEEAMLL